MEYIVVLFKSRNKDNKHIEGFKEMTKQFLVTDVSNVSEKFEEFFSILFFLLFFLDTKKTLLKSF